MNILLTFTGFHDPYATDSESGGQRFGPILSLAQQQEFQRIYLFSTPETVQLTKETKQTLKEVNRDIDVQVKHCNLDEPISYSEILNALRAHWQTIRDESQEATFSISVSSGTPQMHACWVLLAASKEIPAQIINVRPPHAKKYPSLAITNLHASEFPIVYERPIAANIRKMIAAESSDLPPNVDEIVKNLGLIGDHQTLKKAILKAALYSKSNRHILLRGETGTGKDLFARLIHELQQLSGAYIAINCARLEPETAESELFGHVKGSFTGAIENRKGYFELAQNGTLFLDEIGELPLKIQAKLLRVLEDGMIMPIGSSSKPHPVNVRIIAATDNDLENAIEEEAFRHQLYYRFPLEIQIPSLNERKSDIRKIAISILQKLIEEEGVEKILTPEAIECLEAHSWRKSNIRHLKNVISAAFDGAMDRVIKPEDFDFRDKAKRPTMLPEPHIGFKLLKYLSDARTETRDQLIQRALELTNGNKRKAAELLGISYQSVSDIVNEWGSNENPA